MERLSVDYLTTKTMEQGKKARSLYQSHHNSSSPKTSPSKEQPENKDANSSHPQPSLDADMTLLADAVRLQPSTRAALCLYDATTLEDFCLMTELDFESMIVSEARHGRTICPLQQRKILVLLQWIHGISDEHKKNGQIIPKTDNSLEKTKDSPPPPFLHRLTHPVETVQEHRRNRNNIARVAPTKEISNDDNDENCDGISDRVSLNEKESLDEKELFDGFLLIPPNWKEQFHRDFLALKHRLHDERNKDQTKWSLVSETFLSLRWILCGFEG